MQYMLLLYSADDAGPTPAHPNTPPRCRGKETATTVRIRDGETITTDGPFAETKEILGGYYLIDVDDLDGALEWAAKIPLAPHGSVEVRPLMVLPGS